MAFIYHTFTNLGGAAGCTEIASWMTANLPGLFDGYTTSAQNLMCKIDSTTVLQLNNSANSAAGYVAAGESQTHSFNVSSQLGYRGVIADADTGVVVFVCSGGDYPIIILCKNEDGDTCGVSFNTTNNTTLLMEQAGTLNSVQTSDIYVYNFTRGTYQKIPCGFARTEQNAACAYPLVDRGGRKIQNVWVGGSSALRNLPNPIEINIDDSIYCSIKYGWLLIK